MTTQATRSSQARICIPSSGPFTIFGVTRAQVEFTGTPDPATATIIVELEGPDDLRLFVRAPAAALHLTSDVGVLEIGVLRDAADRQLDTRAIACERTISPERIDTGAITGSGLIVCFDCRHPRIAAYRTLFSQPELFFWEEEGTILCSDSIVALLGLLPDAQLNESILPHHYLYRFLWDDRTYVRGIRCLPRGKHLNWDDGKLSIRRVDYLGNEPGMCRFDELNDQALTSIQQTLNTIVSGHLEAITSTKQSFGTLLSGGVDSSLLQTIVNRRSRTNANRTFSYRIEVPYFAPEADYAKHSSANLGTIHSFAPVTSAEYVDLLIKTIALIGRPVPTESEPGGLALARHINDTQDSPAYVFEGSGADDLFGSGLAGIWSYMEQYQRLPYPSLSLRPLELVLRKVDDYRAFLLRSVIERRVDSTDRGSPHFPGHETEMYTDYALALQCFGKESIQNVFDEWDRSEAEILGSTSLTERAHFVSYINSGAALGGAWHQLFWAHGISLVQPYEDERLVRAVLAINPRIRYFDGKRTKPIPRMLLEQRTSLPVTSWPKLGGDLYPVLQQWMRKGVLRELLDAIERPGYLDQKDFDDKLKHPDWFTWNMLNIELFKKHVLGMT